MIRCTSVFERIKDYMKIALTIIFLVICVALIVIVLMQEGKDNGLTATLSGGSDSYWSKNKKHSKEAVMNKVTAVILTVFFILAILISSKWI